MVLRALLVSTDDNAIGILTTVFAEFGMTSQVCAYPTGNFFLPDFKVDALVVDLDREEKALSIIRTVQAVSLPPVVIAVMQDRSLLRPALDAGAHFALYKPVSVDSARTPLEPAIALIKRERRRSLRIPVQVAVKLAFDDASEKDGVLLDLSEEGLDILTAEPVQPCSKLRARFTLPDSSEDVELFGEIAWAHPNGESGIRISDVPDNLHDTLAEYVGRHAPDLPDDEPWQDTGCKLTDLSLGGCYVETVSPLPEGSLIELSLRANHVEVAAEGIVRVMHPGTGMGIEFASRTAAQRSEVHNVLDLLVSCPGTQPKLTIKPVALLGLQDYGKGPAPADPLLHLLRNHDLLSQEDFLCELQQQRSGNQVTPA